MVGFAIFMLQYGNDCSGSLLKYQCNFCLLAYADVGSTRPTLQKCNWDEATTNGKRARPPK